MEKKLLFIALVAGLISTSFVTNAQNGRFSIGAELGLPMGDFGDAASIGFGGSLRYELPVGDNLGLTATAGYLMFGGKEIGGIDGGDWSMIPVQIGGKYYFTENQNGFYAGLELGIHSISYEIPDFEFMGIVIEGEKVSETNLSYAPQIGYHLANVDFGVRYQMIATEGSTTSYLGLRIAYVFGEQ